MMRSLAIAVALMLSSSPVMAQADISGFWGPDFTAGERDQALLDKLPAGTVVIEDAGVAEFPRGEFGGLKLTPDAMKHAEQWQPENEMTLQRVCLVPSIVYSVQGPFPFEVIQMQDVIIFKYEYFDQIRLIYMDGRDHPGDDYPHTKMGFSTGRWDGEELVVETSHIAPSTITNNGLDHTADVRMVERYKLENDGKALHATQWFSDPAVIEDNGGRYMTWTKKPGEHIYPYECDPTFAVEYQEVTDSSSQ